MRNDVVDTVLQIAWLEGWVNTHGAYEKALTKRKVPAYVSESTRESLVKRLESALELTRPLPPLTVGLLLRGARSERGLRPQEIFSRLGVSQNIYQLMEQDAISPLKIQAAVWKKIMKLLNYPLDEMIDILRRTEQLVCYRPAVKGVLARYKDNKKSSMKRSTMEKANAELFAKAILKLPDEREAKLNSLIAKLRDGTGNG